MRFETIIEDKLPRKSKKQNRLILTLVLLINTFFNTILPFLIGFYFAFTQQLLFLFGFIVILFIEVRVEYIDDKIEIQIIRGWR